MSRPAVHLALPVDSLEDARAFYGGTLQLAEGRSSDHWIDWNFYGHQLVTHLAPSRSDAAALSEVDNHDVPIPHFGLLLEYDAFVELADRLKAASISFLIEPYLRFPGQAAEQWTMFFQDPAGNSMEFKSFRDESKVFAQ